MPQNKVKRLEWFKFFPSDFWHGTEDMTNEEVGAYIRLMCKAWINTVNKTDVPPFVLSKEKSLLQALPNTTRRAWNRIKQTVLDKFLREKIDRDGVELVVYSCSRLTLEKNDAVYSSDIHAANRHKNQQKEVTTVKRSLNARKTGENQSGVHKEEEEEEEVRTRVRSKKEEEESSSVVYQNEFLEEEQDMSKFDPFVRIWQEKHGEAALCPYPRDSEKFKNKTIWKELISNHGMDLLLQAFTLWASEQAAEGQTERFPLEKFSRVAGDYMQLIKPLKTTLIRAEQQKNSEDKAAEEYRRLHSGITEQEDKPENTEDIF